MPALTNQKWELACLALAGGNSNRESYRAGGFKYDPGAAARFFKRPVIATRVQEIIAERAQTERHIAQVAAQEAGTDRAWVIRHLKHAALMGLRGHPRHDRNGKRMLDEQGNQIYGKPDIGPAVDALKLIGIDQGMFINRTEIGQPGDFERMTDADLQNALIEQAQKLGLPADAVKMLEYAGPADDEDEE